MSLQKLKAKLKEIGMSQTGTIATLKHRLSLYEKCEELKLCTENGENPCSLKLPVLRKTVAQAGLSCIGSADEMLTDLVTSLAKSSTNEGADIGGKGEGGSSTTQSSVFIAEEILRLGEVDDYETILSLSGVPITKDSSTALLRKAYLKLSRVVHPDKLQKDFPEATKAFQTLVQAFERLGAPPVVDEVSNQKGKKTKVVERSNEGCYRTKVHCPRCKVEWGTNIEGNPKYFYNFLMTGLKQYTCSTCLFQFGCFTATHKCPFCRKDFEYSPQDFHRKITCGNVKCNKPFGFMSYNASNTVLKALYADVKATMEKRAIAKTAKLRRAKRYEEKNSRRNGVDKEAAFSLGLSDTCPRCGYQLQEGEEEAFSESHLASCNNADVHKKYAEVAQKAAEKKRKRVELETKQENAEVKAAFDFLGSKTEQLWLLSAEQLREQAELEGAVSEDRAIVMDKLDLIAELTARRNDGHSGDSRAIVVSKKRKRTINYDALPSIRVLNGMSVHQLRAVAISVGLGGNVKTMSKRKLLAALENSVADTDGPGSSADLIALQT